MTLSEKIASALKRYENNKGIWRRLFSFLGFGYAPAIKALRKLDLKEINEMQILTCFIENMPKATQVSYSIYIDILSFMKIRIPVITKYLKILQQSNLLSKENFNVIKLHNDPSNVVEALFLLDKAQLLTQENFDVIMQHNDPSNVAGALYNLNTAQLLTQENFDVIMQHKDPFKVVEALFLLDEAKLLTQENFDVIMQHKDPSNVAEALFSLDEAKLLTQENFDAIIQHKDPSNVAWALFALNKAQLLTQENFDATMQQKNPSNVAEALFSLDEAKLLTPENFDAIIQNEDPSNVAWALFALNKAQLLTQENFDATLQHKNPSNVPEALFSLDEAKLLTQENFDALIQHEDPCKVAWALLSLNEAHLLTPKNREATIQHDHPLIVATALSALNEVDLLTEANFDQLLNPDNSFLCTDDGYINIWTCIPQHFLTQNMFDQLCVQQRNPQQRIEEFVNLLRESDNTTRAAINNNQSTHTASIHASVSESAIKLWARYGAELSKSKVIEIITAIENDLSNLPDTLQNKAAKTCIKRISQDAFVDPDSKVSTRQLLSLVYLAINDHNSRLASLEDAKKQFIIGLYEIQRGYNLSAEGVDDREEDKVICIAGTFNKLMEKLAGVHADVELLFITKATAAAKLTIIVREEAKSYLNQLSSSEALNNPNNLSNFVELISQIQKDGIEVIWPYIQPKIADRFFDEFGTLFVNRIDPELLTFVDNGKFGELKDLSIYQQRISNSPSYDKYSKRSQQSIRFFPMQTKNSNVDPENAVSTDRASYTN